MKRSGGNETEILTQGVEIRRKTRLSVQGQSALNTEVRIHPPKEGSRVPNSWYISTAAELLYVGGKCCKGRPRKRAPLYPQQRQLPEVYIGT